MNPHPHPVPDQRGQSLSVLVTALIPAFILVVGLAVDGAAYSAGARQAHAVAAYAARAGSDAAAAARLGGTTGGRDAVRVARRVLADAGVSGDVTLRDGVVHVTTHVTRHTTFVSLVGITSVTATGSAAADLRRA